MDWRTSALIEEMVFAAVFMLTPPLIATLGALPAWIFLRKAQWRRWEYVLPTLLFLAQFAVMITSQKLVAEKFMTASNFIYEGLIGVLAIILGVWLRALFPGAYPASQRWSIAGSVFFPLLVFIMVRVIMPTLPE